MISTHSEIAAIAYRFWINGGRIDGYDVDDWLHAEQVLKAVRPAIESAEVVEAENPEVIEGEGVFVEGEVMERKPKPPTFAQAVKKGAKKFMEDAEKVWKKN